MDENNKELETRPATHKTCVGFELAEELNYFIQDTTKSA